VVSDEADLGARSSSPRADSRLGACYDALIWQRNASMAARLVALAGDGRTRFVVLGAGHMVGAKGIPARLAEQGFAVERIRVERAPLASGAAVAPPP
jgi:uncharacterized protein YbaP (TraB family)